MFSDVSAAQTKERGNQSQQKRINLGKISKRQRIKSVSTVKDLVMKRIITKIAKLKKKPSQCSILKHFR